ncbi:c-type cytochrome [Kordiimonas aquimaris]|uniref:c-type cytochrome n=1 Tax=Kordiimonas aquimaris TaxID=707591 RepID=UPI0021D3847F|nr:cytochrome c family protein [Kordiimonas aquimaris]
MRILNKETVITALMVMTATFLPSISATANPDDTSISAEGDAVKGKRLFNRCRACHNLTATARTRIGPNLDSIFGRQAGSAEGFTRYSQVLKEADFIWTEQNLNEWLVQPRSFLPGNKMAFAGLKKEQDRKDLMAYLREATVATE